MNILGMSAKLINILKDFYGGANTRLRLPNAFLDAVDVTQDVIQGDVLSPFLFALF